MHRCLVLLARAALCLIYSWANVYAGDFEYPLTRITDKVHVIYGPFDLPNERNRGFRNNVVIVTTSEGAVVFDPGGSAAAGELVVRKIRGLTDAPVVAIFDSHAHGDHWLGNEGIKRSYPDAVIYGHPRLKSKVEGPDGKFWLKTINRLTKNTADGRRIEPIDKTLEDGDIVTIGDTRFRIYHTGKAHTDNDIMIEIIDQDLLYTGDVVRNGLLGIMEEDASFKGNIAAVDQMLKKQFSYYLPGHGKGGGAEILVAYRTYLETLRETVSSLYEQGLADFEMKPRVVKALAPYAGWSGFDLRVGPHISRAFLEIEAEAF